MVAWNPINKSIRKMVKSFWKWSYLKIFKNIYQEDQKNFTLNRDRINARIAQNCLVHKEYCRIFILVFCKKNLYWRETVQMQEMQVGIFLKKKNTKNLLFQFEETKRKKSYKCKDCPRMLNNIQIYFLLEDPIMKRNGANARNVIRHFLSKEENK